MTATLMDAGEVEGTGGRFRTDGGGEGFLFLGPPPHRGGGKRRRRIPSPAAPEHGRLTQRPECVPYKDEVGGSNPSSPTLSRAGSAKSARRSGQGELRRAGMRPIRGVPR